MITTLALFLFWLSVALMFHSYVLYPVLLQWLAAGKKENEIVYETPKGFETLSGLPDVFVVFSAYNEEKVIREKLESIFLTTYPLNKLKVYIGSDNSTDATNSIINEFAAQYPQMVFFPFTGRNGKAAVLNKLVKEISTVNAVFIFTDANVMFTPDAIFEMVKHFKNESISQVAANILNKGEKQDGISVQEKSYIQRENKIKYLEGLNWGSMMGAFGACYALRASEWKEIPPNYLMEDFYLSMNVLSKNKKAISELKAVCYEDVSNEMEEEFKRKTRIQAGNFQNLSTYWTLLFGFNAVAFCFLSHKVIRWFGPLFILLSYVSNVWLLSGHPFYTFTFVLQNLLLISPLLDAAFKGVGIHLTILRFASYFIIMNIALVKGFAMYINGVKTSAWNPTKRNIETPNA